MRVLGQGGPFAAPAQLRLPPSYVVFNYKKELRLFLLVNKAQDTVDVPSLTSESTQTYSGLS